MNLSIEKTVAVKKLVWNFDAPVDLLGYNNVHTVCEESRCPNRYECSSLKVATFLIGGRECTRACKFCHIATAKPLPLAGLVDKEYDDIMEAAISGGYKYLVITSVARDDDELGLARHFARITRGLTTAGITVELLIPDFHNAPELLDLIAHSGPAVIAHNMETVDRLSGSVRPQAQYRRSLDLFGYLQKHHPNIIRKSAFMVGLGESFVEIKELIDDMHTAQIDVVSIGQYLRPSPEQAKVVKVYTAEEFKQMEVQVAARGFLAWEIGPFVRSSYMAAGTLAKVEAERMRRTHAKI